MKSLTKFIVEANDHFPIQVSHYTSDEDARDLYDAIDKKFKGNKKYNYLGSGCFSSAYTRHDTKTGIETDPHHIIRVTKSHNRAEKDPSIGYLIQASTMAHENPHLPRVHELHSIEASGGNAHVHIAKMEKLHPLDSIEHDEARAAFHHAFGHDTPLTHADDIGDDIVERWERNDIPKHSPLGQVRNMVGQRSSKYIHNEDMHKANFMFRRTPVGTQLVITDPLS